MNWQEFKKLVLIDKTVQKCKGIVNTSVNKKVKSVLTTPQQLKLLPIERFSQNKIALNDIKCVEKSTLKLLSIGKYKIDISVDLHGYSIENSYKLFYQTFYYAISNHLKLILVITGKGTNENSIRNELMKWVNVPEISSYVLFITQASSQHGGDGAFYILLRKKRNGGSGRS